MSLPPPPVVLLLLGVAGVPLAYVVGKSPPGSRRGLAAFGLFVLGMLLFLYLDAWSRASMIVTTP